MNGCDLEESNRRALATGAICVSGRGGHSTPNERELAEFLRGNDND
jgi:hypothetical protein